MKTGLKELYIDKESSEKTDNPSGSLSKKSQVEPNVIKINDAFEAMKDRADQSEKSEEYTEYLEFMKAKDKLPFSIVEKEGFQTFVKNLKPRYTLPS